MYQLPLLILFSHSFFTGLGKWFNLAAMALLESLLNQIFGNLFPKEFEEIEPIDSMPLFMAGLAATIESSSKINRVNRARKIPIAILFSILHKINSYIYFYDLNKKMIF